MSAGSSGGHFLAPTCKKHVRITELPPAASCCSSSEISGRLQGITRVSPAPSEEVPLSRSDTASLPAGSKPCSQPSQTCLAGHHPLLFPAALLIQRSHSWTQSLLCPPLALEISSQTPSASLDGFGACQILEQSSLAAQGTCWLLTAMLTNSVQCCTELPSKGSARSRVMVGSRQLLQGPPPLC